MPRVRQENRNSSKQWEFTELDIKSKNINKKVHVVDLFCFLSSVVKMFLFGKTNHFEFILLAYLLKAF